MKYKCAREGDSCFRVVAAIAIMILLPESRNRDSDTPQEKENEDWRVIARKSQIEIWAKTGQAQELLLHLLED